MTDSLTFWILGCLFGIIVGWLFASAYYWDKIRKIRLEYLEEQKELNNRLRKIVK